MRRDVGFFEVDSREVSACGDGLAYRLRVASFETRLGQLTRFARAGRIPVVCTPCVNAGPVGHALGEDVVFVSACNGGCPPAGSLRGLAEIWLERKNCGSPECNYRAGAHDIFSWNPNADVVLRALGIPKWVVFGDSVGYCLRATVIGLLRMGSEVTVVEDAVGPGTLSDREAEAVLRELQARGARMATTDRIIADLSPGPGCLTGGTERHHI